MTTQDSSIRAAIVEVFGQVFSLPESTVAQGVTPDRVAGWDSARHVELVIALEERFQCVFEPDDVPSLTTLERIESIVSRYVQTSTP